MANAIFKNALGMLAASAALISTTAQVATAQQGFTGSFAPEQWQLFNGSPAFPGVDTTPILINDIPLALYNGSVDFTEAPDALTLFGSNQSGILTQFGLTCESTELPVAALFLCDQSFTALFVTVPETSILSFNWDYVTSDFSVEDDFGPAFDPFGYAIASFPPGDPRTDGRFIELIDRNGPTEQMGMALVEVAANQIFGFEIGTADNQNGRAQVTISDFMVMVTEADAVVPESVPEPTSGIAIALLAGIALRASKQSR